MIEELPYAPRRKRPLSLWNPLDYLVLLYWVFYFPQAIRWYVERFGSLPWNTNGWVAIRGDPVQRRLAVQAIGVLVIGVVLAWLVARAFGISLLGVALTMGAIMGVLIAFAIGAVFGVASGAAFGSLFGIGMSVSIGLEAHMSLKGACGLVFGLVLGTSFGVTLGLVLGAGIAMQDGDAESVIGDVGGGTAASIILGLWLGVGAAALLAVAGGAPGALLFGVSLSLASVGMLYRLDVAVLALLPALSGHSRSIAIRAQRSSALALRGVEDDLYGRLERNWADGLKHCEGLLRYTLQFVPVVRAINRSLASTQGSDLFPRIAHWCDASPVDWQAMRFLSASLSAEFTRGFWSTLVVVPHRWRPHVDVKLRIDTPARAACAGFWLLHKGSPLLAADAFEQVRHLPFGEEMHVNSAALATALGCKQFQQIAAWLPPTPPDPEQLRPAVAQCLNRLGEAARDAHLVLHSRSIRERSSALNRIIGNLKALQSNPSQCPQPERVVLVKIVDRWMDLAQRVAADVGTLEVREPVASPYIVGAPVPADRLVGRESVFEEIRSVWAKPGQRDSLLVYGHRRMGKTSVMRSVLEHGRLGSDTGLAYLTMQLIDPAMPLADLCRAIASELRRAAQRMAPGIAPALRSRSARDRAGIPVGTPVGWVERSETHPPRHRKPSIAAFRRALPSLQDEPDPWSRSSSFATSDPRPPLPGPSESEYEFQKRSFGSGVAKRSFATRTGARAGARAGTRTTSGRAIRHRRQERCAPFANASPTGVGASYERSSVGTAYERRSLSAQTSPIAELRDFFDALHDADKTRRYILVLDEYELLDRYLSPAQASAFVALLRGLTQQYPWLAVALVGLHRLQERSASLYEPIYAWRSVRVSFLDTNGVADVLQVDTDDFPLAFSPECLASIHRLTAGQPFLVQLLGDRLVDRFNRRLREEIHPPPATFSADDVEALVAAQSLYTQGAGYFRGIWAQAGEGPAGQHAILRALAPTTDGLPLPEAARASGLAGAGLDEALQSLIDHDVLLSSDGRYRFTVELMRRWVAGGWMERDAAGI